MDAPTHAMNFAQELTTYLQGQGWPVLGVTLRATAVYPLVEVWDDDALIMRLIACTDAVTELSDAAYFASVMAAALEASDDAPCGVSGIGICPSGWLEWT